MNKKLLIVVSLACLMKSDRIFGWDWPGSWLIPSMGTQQEVETKKRSKRRKPRKNQNVATSRVDKAPTQKVVSVKKSTVNGVTNKPKKGRGRKNQKQLLTANAAAEVVSVPQGVLSEPELKPVTRQEKKRAKVLAHLDREVAERQAPAGQLGKMYYNALLDKSVERHWAIPITAHYSFGNRAFDCEGNNCSLKNLVFGTNSFSVQDVFLLSRLSRDAQVSIARDNFPGFFQRPTNPPVGSTLHGLYGSDQYVGTLADVQIGGLEADRRELGFDIGFIYRFRLGHQEKLMGSVGVNLPFRSVEHILGSLDLSGGDLSPDPIVTTSPGASTLRRSSIQDFFSDYIDVEGFFRSILDQKGLCLKNRQRKTSIGDIELFGVIDFADYTCNLDALQVGVNFVLPSGNKDSGQAIWEPILGNGGAFQVDVFGQVIWNGPINAINPSFRLAASFSAPFTSNMRVSKKISSSNGVAAESGVIRPINEIDGLGNSLPDPIRERFGLYFVQPFDAALDSTVSMFASQAVPVRTKLGHKILFGIGNYAYNIFDLGLRFGAFYEFMHKRQDDLKVKCGDCDQFDLCPLLKQSEQRAHTFSWNLVYEAKNMMEVSIGSMHVFTGRNVRRHREIFGSLTLVF
jgi:hypothetical protein